jgi:hypothetical protein
MGIAKMIAKSAGKSLATTSKNEVGEAASKRVVKNMGAAERVAPARLSGPAAAAPAPAKSSLRNKVIAGSAVAGALGVASSGGDKPAASKSSAAPAKASAAASAPAKSDDKPSSRNSSDGSPATKSFGSAFAAARKEGKVEFTFNGKKYHTRTKEEESKKSSVREGKNNNIDDDSRKRALDSIKNLNKGGMVKKCK